MKDQKTWTKLDSELATKEGWNLYDSRGSVDGDIQVQRNDEQGLLKSDIEAWKLVKEGKEEHHKKAKRILKDQNPNEHKRILNQK